MNSNGATTTLQWKKDGANISGATSEYYSKSNATTADVGVYTLTATNSAGTTTSNGARVTLREAAAPSVSSISSPVSVAVGGSFSLYVSVSGTGPFTYQWRKDSVSIPGATSSSYSKSSVAIADAGTYSVLVTNSVGYVMSPGVSVSVSGAQPPVITYHPPSRALSPGGYVGSLYVGVSGTGPMTYQWKKDGVATGSSTNELYLGYSAAATMAGTYTVTVTNSQGSVTSEPCVVTVLAATAPTIRSQPTGYAVYQGESFSLYSDVLSSSSVTYQWRKDGVAIPGATNYSYGKSNVASSDAGSYSYVATNSVGSVTSDTAAISVVAPPAPQIVAHPASVSLLPGDYFSGLYAEATPGTGLRYQWKKDGVDIPNATSSYYHISNAQPSVAGSYTVVVSNAAGTVTSREGVVTVDSFSTRPVITSVPGGRAIMGGSYADLYISTSSSGETVQWYKDGIIIANATSKQYSFSNFGPSSVGSYTAQVTTTAGTFTSRAILLEMREGGISPRILQQPVAMSVSVGASINFSVSAAGEQPLTYQWRKDGTAISGATNTYYYPSTSAAGEAKYSVVVTNRLGNVTSADATLKVTARAVTTPVIMTHPASQTYTQGSGSLSLYVSLVDNTGVTYQWRRDGTPIAGATGNELYLYSGSIVAGRYSVVVTNSAGSATSQDAVIATTTLATAPVFSTQPKNASGYTGGSVTLTGVVTGTAPITYQWRKDGTIVANATSNSLTLNSLTTADAGSYTLTATDVNGSTPSNAATVTVTAGTLPTFSRHPESLSALGGTGATFTVLVGGDPAPTVQWQRNGSDIAGATGTTYTIPAVTMNHAGVYSAVARNAVGSSNSSSAVLTVYYAPPTIQQQPANVSVQPGGIASFSVGATALPEATYQWRKDGVSIAGANQSTLNLGAVTSTHAGRYSVVITTAFGSVTSVEAVLTVGSPIAASISQTTLAQTGATVTLTPQISSADPVLLRWAFNGTVIAGETSPTLTLRNITTASAGVYSVEIRRSDGTVVFPLTGSAAIATTLIVSAPPRPAFSRQPESITIDIGGTATFNTQVHIGGNTTASNFTYRWEKDGATLPGRTSANLTLTNVQPSDAGDYQAIVTAFNGTMATSDIARLTVRGSASAGTYFGTFENGDSWALHVRADGTAVFIALLASRNQAIAWRNLTVSPSGAFTFGRPRPVAAADAPALTARYYDGEGSAVISSAGGLTGRIPDLSLNFTGTRTDAAAGGATPAGHFEAVPVASDLGQIDAIAAPDGSMLLVSVDAGAVRGGRGQVTSTGVFAITNPQYSFAGQITPASGRLQGDYQPTGGVTTTFATPAPGTGVERLANVATRGIAGSGARTLTAGFVIAGTGGKDVLVRAVGPALSGFGVPGVLANPRLKLFKDGAPVIENDDWALGGFSSQIAEAAARVGAFALPASSADAAVLLRLDPGAYTAQVSGATEAAGVALIEVYDAATAQAGGPKLINLSTRGEVGRDGDILIVGVVVSGDRAKKLLIRGIGPALGAFGVEGALADPQLQLYQGSTLVRQNDNWSESADATSLAEAARSVGAFTLLDGSKDAALLRYLTPGSYTAQIRGA
ncbi:MAG TPA: immunoglobulin domain-containing protein, partial [Opitutaceae bacterium]